MIRTVDCGDFNRNKTMWSDLHVFLEFVHINRFHYMKRWFLRHFLNNKSRFNIRRINQSLGLGNKTEAE